MAHHKRRSRQGPADESRVDNLLAGLNSRPQESVRRAAQHQSLFPGDANQLHPLLQGGGQGLFGIHVFPRQQRGPGHVVMLIGSGDVQHDVHFRVGKGFVHVPVNLRNLRILLHRSLSPFGNQVAHPGHFQVIEGACDVLQINAADVAHADNRNFCHVLPHSFLYMTSTHPAEAMRR